MTVHNAKTSTGVTVMSAVLSISVKPKGSQEKGMHGKYKYSLPRHSADVGPAATSQAR